MMKFFVILSLIFSLLFSAAAHADCTGAYQDAKLRKKERNRILDLLDETETDVKFRVIYFHDVWQYAFDRSRSASLRFVDEVQDGNFDIKPRAIAKLVRDANTRNILCPAGANPMRWDEIVAYAKSHVANAQH